MNSNDFGKARNDEYHSDKSWNLIEWIKDVDENDLGSNRWIETGIRWRIEDINKVYLGLMPSPDENNLVAVINGIRKMFPDKENFLKKIMQSEYAKDNSEEFKQKLFKEAEELRIRTDDVEGIKAELLEKIDKYEDSQKKLQLTKHVDKLVDRHASKVDEQSAKLRHIVQELFDKNQETNEEKLSASVEGHKKATEGFLQEMSSDYVTNHLPKFMNEIRKRSQDKLDIILEHEGKTFGNAIIKESEQKLTRMHNDAEEKIATRADAVEKHLGELKEKISCELGDRIGEELTKTVNSDKVDELVQGKIKDRLEESILKIPGIVSEEARKLIVPRLIILPDKKKTGGWFFSNKPQAEVTHHKFDDLMEYVSINDTPMLKGPAGSGKGFTVKQVAKAHNLDFYHTNSATNEFKLTGFVNAGGVYQETPFYRAFKYGGLFFLDEIDTSDATVLIVLNEALANGYMSFPNSPEPVYAHENFRMMSAANTWGQGADSEYVGRFQLDASSLDRMPAVPFGYDKGVEKVICPNKDILEFMWSLRDVVEEDKTRMVVSTRGIDKFYRQRKLTKLSDQSILQGLITKGHSRDTIDSLIGGLAAKGVTKNRYFKGLVDLAK